MKRKLMRSIGRILDKCLKAYGKSLIEERIAVGDIVSVRVLEVDEKKKRISLTMRQTKPLQ